MLRLINFVLCIVLRIRRTRGGVSIPVIHRGEDTPRSKEHVAETNVQTSSCLLQQVLTVDTSIT